MINWYAGWILVLCGFATGALIGLFFHKEHFLGGYDSFPRRIVRLGHISLAALGMMNVLYGLSPASAHSGYDAQVASLGFLIGGITMPLVCFLTAWKPWFRHGFFIPVTALIAAVIHTLRNGPS